MAKDQVTLPAVSRQVVELSLSNPPTHSFNRQLLRIILESTDAQAATLWLVRESELIRCEEIEQQVGAVRSIQLSDHKQQAALRDAYEEGHAVVLADLSDEFDPLRPDGNRSRKVVFLPVTGVKGSVGVLRLVLPPAEQQVVSHAVQLAETLCGYYSLYAAQRILSLQKQERQAIDRLSKAVVQLQHYTFSTELPDVIVNSAMEIAAIDRAVLVVAHGEEEMEVSAVSSVPDADRKGAWSRLVCELGQLVLRQDNPVRYAPQETELEDIEQEDLRPKLNSYCLMTEARDVLLFPLGSGEQKAGVLVVECYGDTTLTPFERVLCAVYATHAGTALVNQRLFRRVPLSGIYARRLDREAKGVRGEKSLWGRVAKWGAVAASFIALAWFVGIHPVVEKTQAQCFVAPSQNRIVSAGVGGEVARVNFQQGQRVEQGDLLIALRTDEMELELAKERNNARNLEAQIARLGARLNQRTAPEREAEALAEVRSLRHTLAAKQEQIKLLEHYLAESELRAPIDGVVLEPQEPDQLLGVTVRRGEPLCRVGSIDENVVVKVAVPGDRAAGVRPGYPVRIHLRPLITEAGIRGTVAELSERSVTYKNSNVFMADVVVSNEARAPGAGGEPYPVLKPGMTGKAKIELPGTSTYLSIYGRRLYRKVKFWLF